jgi:hypothetical protein
MDVWLMHNHTYSYQAPGQTSQGLVIEKQHYEMAINESFT